MVEGESVNSALSLDGVIDIGLVPTAEYMASEADADVTGASVCWKLGPIIPYIRGTFEIR